MGVQYATEALKVMSRKLTFCEKGYQGNHILFAITALTQNGGALSSPAFFHFGPCVWVQTNTSHSKALTKYPH